MARSRRYIFDALDQVIPEGGAFSRDLVIPVSEIVGKNVTVQSIGMHLHAMHEDGKIRRVPVKNEIAYFYYPRRILNGERYE